MGASSGSQGPLDDGPAIARILQQGFARCKHKKPADGFLEPLGVLGDTYEALQVEDPAPSTLRPRLPTAALVAFDESSKFNYRRIGKEDCETKEERVALRQRLGSSTVGAPLWVVLARVPWHFQSASCRIGRACHRFQEWCKDLPVCACQ